MNRVTKLLGRVRIAYRRSTTLTKAVVVSAVVLAMTALIALQLTVSATRDRTEDLANQAAQYEHQNQQLKDSIEDLGSADSVEQIAKDELGLVDPDTVIIEDEE